MAGIRKKRRAYVEQRDCVACGCCVYCPMGTMPQLICKAKTQNDPEEGFQ